MNYLFRFVIMSFLTTLLFVSYAIASPSQLSWRDGTPELVRLTRELLKNGQNVPQRENLPTTHPKVGTVRSFYAIDMSGTKEKEYMLFSTLQAVSEHAYWYVENSQWGRRVTEADIKALVKAFEQSTPIHSRKGIYTLESDGLGPIPDTDDTPLHILILDIRDGSNGNGSFVAGYFFPLNQYKGSFRSSSGELFHSNETELLYIDSNPLNIRSLDAQGIVAHELAHLIHWGFDSEEDIWIDEGCADYAMWLMGYQLTDHISSFELSPNVSLVENSAFDLANYGASFLWVMYLQEQFGKEIVPSLISNQATGIEGVNATLVANGHGEDFDRLYMYWKISNFLDDPSFDARYGYKSLDLHIRPNRQHHSYPIKDKGQLLPYASDYLELKELPSGSGKALELQFISSSHEYVLDIQVVVLKGGDRPLFVKPMQVNLLNGERTFTISLSRESDRIVFIPSFQPKERLRLSAFYTYSAQLVSLPIAAAPSSDTNEFESYSERRRVNRLVRRSSGNL